MGDDTKMNNDSNVIESNDKIFSSVDIDKSINDISDKEKIELLKDELNLVFYTQKLFFEDLSERIRAFERFLDDIKPYVENLISKDEAKFLNFDLRISCYKKDFDFLKNYEPLKKLYNVFEEDVYNKRIECIFQFKEYLGRKVEEQLLMHRENVSYFESDLKWKIKELVEEQKKRKEASHIQYDRCVNFFNSIMNGGDFFENLKSNPYELLDDIDIDILESKFGKEYSKYFKHADEIKQERTVEGFRDYQTFMGIEKESRIERQNKDYTRYKIIGKDPEYELKNISKRQLPTEIFKFLIFSNIIKSEDDLKVFSTNQFGRTFESTMGDVLSEDELPKDEKRQKRYNMIDLSCPPEKVCSCTDNLLGIDLTTYKNSNKIYVSNQWGKDSIDKFIDFIHEHYSEYIKIGHSKKDN